MRQPTFRTLERFFRRFASILATTALAFAIAAPARAQESQISVMGMGRGNASVEVDVQDTAGTPLVSQALVELLQADSEAPIASGVSNEGVATFTQVPAGEFMVTASAAGYESGRAEVDVAERHGVYRATVTLTPMGNQAAANSANLNPLLAPKARKELQKGLDALKAKNFGAARKHVNAALKLAPSDPNVNFVRGMLSLQTGDRNDAENYFLKATSLNPKHVPALVGLGEVRLEDQNYNGALEPLTTAVQVAPRNWMAHWLLAATALSTKQFAKAVSESRQALKLGKGAAAGARFTEGEALLALGEHEAGLRVLESFVKDSPADPEADSARTLISEVRSGAVRTPGASPASGPQPGSMIASGGTGPLAPPASSPVATADPRPTPSNVELPISAYSPGSLAAEELSEPAADSESASSNPELNLPAWQPPSVDDEHIVLAQGASCPARLVLERAAGRAEELASNLNQTEATESVKYESVNRTGKPAVAQEKAYRYMALISRTKSNLLVISEDRTGGPDPSYPGHMATFGASALAFVFHPDLRQDFQFTCRGLGNWDGQAAWIVDFNQRPDRPRDLRTYQLVNGNGYAADLKGRAWISARNYRLLRIEGDLAKPIQEIGLDREHDIVTFGAVHFRSGNTTIWLPLQEDLYFDIHNHAFRREQSYGKYSLFYVSASEEISPPKNAPAPLVFQQRRDDHSSGR